MGNGRQRIMNNFLQPKTIQWVGVLEVGEISNLEESTVLALTHSSRQVSSAFWLTFVVCCLSVAVVSHHHLIVWNCLRILWDSRNMSAAFSVTTIDTGHEDMIVSSTIFRFSTNNNFMVLLIKFTVCVCVCVVCICVNYNN